MSNFADIAYDNYLMHYRTKGSKNGYTKDPDYTPVGEKARKMQINKYSNQARRGDYAGMPSSVGEAKERARRDKIDRLAEENRKRNYEIGRLHNQTYRGERFQGDFAGMPSSVAERFREKRISDANDRYNNGLEEKDKLSRLKSKGDYAGMPSSAREAQEKAARAYAINKLYKQANKGDYAGMPSSALTVKERNAEIKKLYGQANRGDLGGMPSSAREAKESANRASEISRLRTQRLRGDYAGMPSSALEAKENAQSARIEEAKARYQKLNAPIEMKRQAEAKRKAEYMKRQAEANRLDTTYEKSKRYREAYNSRVKPNYDAIEEMKGRAEAKRLNSPYEKSRREQAANENRERELLLAENKRRQRVTQKEKKRAEEIERNNAAKSERDRTVKDWEDIVGLNKSNSALRSSNGYESRLMKEKKRVAKMTGKSPKDLRREKRDALLKKYGITPFSNGKWRKV